MSKKQGGQPGNKNAKKVFEKTYSKTIAVRLDERTHGEMMDYVKRYNQSHVDGLTLSDLCREAVISFLIRNKI